MNFKTITLALVVTLALVSCKKEIEVKKEFQENAVTEQKDTLSAATNPDGKFAKMEFSAPEHDFGTINGEDKVETVFIFTNTGETDLVISKAHGSCGCTVPDYPKQPIAPGQKGDIKVSFNPKGKNGMQNKTVTLTVNTEAGVEKLTIKANIVK
ncbi:DUF1573 domain-containing protein [Flavobacterium sp.]|uniref:DUF1573 domain-containing protein n=1 Tax=Flavobacterium sp. TaxID=239 RepID=UPI0026160EBE|nr:DUF1573 domain-containing protein [Flavobacterium sp.]MDD3004166.1 DUF1573 domain-containing protein [Flavobacterium sp.]